MSKRKIVQAWKNPAFRQSLTATERAALPANPAGATRLNENELEQVAGGLPQSTLHCSWICPTLFCTVWCTWEC